MPIPLINRKIQYIFIGLRIRGLSDVLKQEVDDPDRELEEISVCGALQTDDGWQVEHPLDHQGHDEHGSDSVGAQDYQIGIWV